MISYTYKAFYCNIANELFSLIEDTLIIADNSGKVYQLTLNPAGDGDNLLCHQLPSSHQPGKTMYLFRLHGTMSVKGSLSSIGNHLISIKNGVRIIYTNTIGDKSIPCVVLLGLRAGYGMLQSANDPNPSMYFTAWTFPAKSQHA